MSAYPAPPAAVPRHASTGWVTGSAAAANHTGAQPREPGTDDTDESTRLLCIGAHLDRDFGEAAIREFLGQPCRAAAPSLGVDAAAVLQECLERRRRRRNRDGWLAVLMTAFAVLMPGLLVSWAVVATIWRTVGPSRRRLDRLAHRTSGPFEWVPLLGLVLTVFLLSTLVSLGLLLIARADPTSDLAYRLAQYRYGAGGVGPTLFSSPLLGATEVSTNLVVPALLSAGMLAVLWNDRYGVWLAVCRRLRREEFARNTAGNRRSMPVAIQHGSLARNLAQLGEEAKGAVNCVVYRGDRPFIGNGVPQGPWSIAISLEPVRRATVLRAADGTTLAVGGGDDTVPELSVLELYEAVRADLLGLSGMTSLSPSHRLRRIDAQGKIFLPARAIRPNLGSPELRTIINDPHHRPSAHVSGETLQWIAEAPREWLRYYDCFVVESWDREAIVSMLVHFGLDDRNLYLECIPCALRPVKQRYHGPDRLSAATSTPAVLDALGSWTVLPLTILRRTRGLFRQAGERLADDDDARRYGAAGSLRELAAGNEFADYAQESDVHRYLQILRTRLIRAVGAHLESRGISVVDFMRQADRTTVNQIGGDYHHVQDSVLHNVNIGRDNAMSTTVGAGGQTSER